MMTAHGLIHEQIFHQDKTIFHGLWFFLFQATNQSWAEATSALRWCQNTTLQGKRRWKSLQSVAQRIIIACGYY